MTQVNKTKHKHNKKYIKETTKKNKIKIKGKKK